MLRLKTYGFLSIFFLIVTLATNGQSIVDNGEFFKTSEKKKLRSSIKLFQNATKSEIVIYSILNSKNKNIKELATDIMTYFGRQQKELNNNIFIFLSKKNNKLEIIKGNGLDWSLTDLEINALKEKTIPFLKKHDYFDGLNELLLDLKDEIQKENWTIKSTEIPQITQEDFGKILKFKFESTSKYVKNNNFNKESEELSDDYYLVIKSGEIEFKLYYSKHMKKLITKIITEPQSTILARLTDFREKKLELISVE
jgi:uncharacterized membrane protein YgcG